MHTIFRTLIISLLLLLPAAIRAENWQTFELHAPAGMTGRSVSVNGSNIGSFSLSQWQWWNGSETVTNGEAVLGDVQIDIDQAGPWIFESGGWQAEVSSETLQGAVGSPGMLQLEFANAGVPVIELLLPVGYAGSYSLAVVQLDDEDAPVLTPVSYSGEVSGTSVQGEAYVWQRAIAPRDPSRSFYIRNLTTSMRSPSDLVHLGDTAWIPDGGTPDPLVSVTFYLDPAHYGYSFTLHYQSPNQAEMVQSLTAWPSEVEGNRTMGNGQVVNVTGSMSVTGSVARGATYWLTLDASGEAIGPAFYLDPQASYPTPLQWSLLTEPPPETTLQTLDFYVPSGMTGGYIYQPSAQRELSEVVSSGYIEDYDGNASPHFFYYDVRTAEIDPNEPLWLRINGTELSQGEQWYYDGWSALNGPSSPPPTPTFTYTLVLPASRRFHSMELQGDAGLASSLDSTLPYVASTTRSITLNDPWHGDWTLELEVIEIISELYDHLGTGYQALMDWTTGESQPVSAGTTDLSQWWLPPEPQSLQVSLSRWGHDLRIRQRNGDVYSIAPGSSQGNLALLSGTTWYQSYYYFDASGLRRPNQALDWWVYDADTGEESPWNQTDLINWIALRQPNSVTAAGRDEYGNIILYWGLESLGEIEWLTDGGFYIEQQIDGGVWSSLSSGAVASYFNADDSNNSFILGSTPSDATLTCRYRVAYYYGNPARRSTWVESNEIALRSPPPLMVQAVQTAATALELRWQIAATWASNPPTGDFQIEHLVSQWTEEVETWEWQPVATVAAASVVTAGTVTQFRLAQTGLNLGESYRYQICYIRNGLWSVPAESNSVTLVLDPNGDEDGDGMLNGWEIANDLNPLYNDALGDADGDGWKNIDEFRMGTMPRLSTVKITITAPADAVFWPGQTQP